MTQEQQVIETMRELGGYATFKRLNATVDFSTWKTKTPEASVRRIVQNSKRIFKIQPGLWALEEYREEVLKIFDLKIGNPQSEELFTHSYFQGLLVEIGKLRHQTTYVPAQDKNRLFIGQKLCELTDTTIIPKFTYENLLKRARTVDVIWFNERNMPSAFYEVEHTTNIKNSLSKFYELQDFQAGFFIVADINRKKEFEDKLHVSMFSPIEERVEFLEYDKVANMYEGLSKVNASLW
jgi:hypothetical protein